MSSKSKTTSGLTATLVKHYLVISITLLIAIVGTFQMSFGSAAVRSAYSGTAEKDNYSRINTARVNAGKNKVVHVECLNRLAERWSKNLAAKGYLYHNPYVGGNTSTTWSIVSECGARGSGYGETIAYGTTPSGVFSSFMNSPGHKAIILSKDYYFNRVGVGSYYDANGRLWVTYVFANCGSYCGSTKWKTTATYPAN